MLPVKLSEIEPQLIAAGQEQDVEVPEFVFRETHDLVKVIRDLETKKDAGSKFCSTAMAVVVSRRAGRKFRKPVWTVCVIGADGSKIFRTTVGGSRAISFICALLAKTVGIPVKQQRIFVLGMDSDQPAEKTMTIAEAATAASVASGCELQLYLEVNDAAGGVRSPPLLGTDTVVITIVKSISPAFVSISHKHTYKHTRTHTHTNTHTQTHTNSTHTHIQQTQTHRHTKHTHTLKAHEAHTCTHTHRHT